LFPSKTGVAACIKFVFPFGGPIVFGCLSIDFWKFSSDLPGCPIEICSSRSFFGSSRSICRATRSFLGFPIDLSCCPIEFWSSRSISEVLDRFVRLPDRNFAAPDRFLEVLERFAGLPDRNLRLPIDFHGSSIEILRFPIVFWQFSSDFPGACAISALLRGFRTACKNKGRQICRPLLFNRYLKTPVSSAYTPSHLHANLHVLKQNQWLLLRGPAGFLHHSVHHQSYMPAPVLIHAIF